MQHCCTSETPKFPAECRTSVRAMCGLNQRSLVSTVVHSENISIVCLVETKRQYGLRIYSRVIHAMKVRFNIVAVLV